MTGEDSEAGDCLAPCYHGAWGDGQCAPATASHRQRPCARRPHKRPPAGFAGPEGGNTLCRATLVSVVRAAQRFSSSRSMLDPALHTSAWLVVMPFPRRVLMPAG